MQDYYQIRNDCLASGKLFEDPEFPAKTSSVFFSKTADIMWQRPSVCEFVSYIFNGLNKLGKVEFN